jgi:hypothetical protein
VNLFFHLDLICRSPTLESIMATLAEVQASTQALTEAVTTVEAKVATLKSESAASPADLDGVKASIDAAVTALQTAAA